MKDIEKELERLSGIFKNHCELFEYYKPIDGLYYLCIKSPDKDLENIIKPLLKKDKTILGMDNYNGILNHNIILSNGLVIKEIYIDYPFIEIKIYEGDKYEQEI